MLLRPIQRNHLHRFAGAHLREHLVDRILRDYEDHRDRLQLRDHAQAGRSVGAHHVAGIDVAQSDAAVDGRDDARIVDIDLGGVEIALVKLHGTFIFVHRRLLRGQFLLGNGVFLVRILIADEIDAGVLQQGFIAFQLTLRLKEGSYIRPRVDDRQKVVLLDDLTFLEPDLGHHPRHAAHDGIGIHGRDIPEGVEVDIDIAQRDRGDADRYGLRGLFGLGLFEGTHDEPNADENRDQDDGPDHPTAFSFVA